VKTETGGAEVMSDRQAPHRPEMPVSCLTSSHVASKFSSFPAHGATSFSLSGCSCIWP